MPRKDASTAPANAQAQQEAASDGIDNYELPKSLVTRIAKSAIPDNAKLQKDTVLALVKGSTVFINFLAATAHDIAISRQHKSVSASDVLKALEAIQFGDMVDHLQEELKVYRELAKSNKKGGSKDTSARSKGKGKAADAASHGASTSAVSNGVRGNGSVADADMDEDMLDVSQSANDENEGEVEEEEGEGGEAEADELEDIDMEDEDVDELAEDVEEDVEGEPEGAGAGEVPQKGKNATVR